MSGNRRALAEVDIEDYTRERWPDGPTVVGAYEEAVRWGGGLEDRGQYVVVEVHPGA